MKKLDNQWNGPFLVVEVKEVQGTYLLSKLDGTIMDGIFPEEQLKQFFPRKGVLADAEDEADDGGVVAEGVEEDDEE